MPRLLIGLPLALIALYVAGWFIGAEVIKGRVTDRLESMGDRGYDVSVDTLTVEGFPTRFDITVAGYTIATPSGITGHGEAVRAGASVFDFVLDRSVDIEAIAEQTVELPGVPPMTVRVAGADGEVRLAGFADPRPQSGHVVVQDLTVSAPGRPAAPILTVAEARYGQAVPLVREDGSRDVAFGGLAVALETVGLPDGAGRTLPDIVDSIRADLAVSRPWPARPTAPAMTAWRDAGGVVEVTRFHLAWGEVRLVATGTLSLDDALQPQGRLDATVEGMDQLIQAAAGGGEGTGGLTGLSLGLFGGGGGGVTLPLTIADGRVGLGPVPLARLPAIVWQTR